MVLVLGIYVNGCKFGARDDVGVGDRDVGEM